MSKIWFTADTHFGHQRTLELSKRPFKTEEEMDSTMIKNWNSVVGKDDTVYHLGDFGAYENINKLNGNISLILGNYERNDLDKDIVTVNDLFDLFISVKRNALNVGVDCHNFRPISIETVEFYRNAIENHYDEEVFM